MIEGEASLRFPRRRDVVSDPRMQRRKGKEAPLPLIRKEEGRERVTVLYNL